MLKILLPLQKISVVLFIAFVLITDVWAEKIWIPSWQAASELTVARAGAAFVKHGNYIFALGGVDGKVFLDSVERAVVNPDGSLGPWQIVSQLPEARGFFSAVTYSDRLYAAGGGNGQYGKNLLNSIVSARINLDGTLGNWRTEPNSMLLPRRCAKLFINQDKLYAVGGFGGALLDTVEYASINADGELSEWVMSPEKLTTPRYVNELKKVGSLVFAIGGHHESSGKGLSSVEYLDVASSGQWHKTVDLAQGRYAFSGIVVDENIYVMGGLSGAEYLDSVEVSTPNDLMQGKKWKQATTLPYKMANFSALEMGDKVYIFGGSTRSGYLREVWFAELNSQGSIGYFGDSGDLEKIKQRKLEAGDGDLPNRGSVIQAINSSDYTYLLIATKKGDKWIAAPRTDISTGAKVRFSEGVYMSNFYSKTLNRKFDSILFVGTVIPEN